MAVTGDPIVMCAPLRAKPRGRPDRHRSARSPRNATCRGNRWPPRRCGSRRSGLRCSCMELRPLPLVSFSGGRWLLRRPRHIGPQLSGRLARMPRSSENVPASMLGLPPRAREKGSKSPMHFSPRACTKARRFASRLPRRNNGPSAIGIVAIAISRKTGSAAWHGSDSDRLTQVSMPCVAAWTL